MKKVKNKLLLKKYINKYKINDIFTDNYEEYMSLILFKKNDYICKYGDEISDLLFFVKGRAKVYITLSNGKSLLLCFYYPFMVLGDLEFTNPNKATSNTQVIEDTYCISIPIKKVRERLSNDAKFLQYISNSLALKLERASNNSTINLLYPLENRLASYMIATMYKGKNNKFEFKENLTWTSELLGTSYRHLLRTLNCFVEEEIIMKEDNCYFIANEKRLREMAADIYK